MRKTAIQLSDHFTFQRLLRFTFPTIVMLVFTSVYSVVDGFFVSNFVGKTPFAAVNFIMPLLIILGCTGFMFGTGGGALISKTLGKGEPEKANELFSLIVYAALVSGILTAVVGFLTVRPAAALMGAAGQLLEDSVTYGKIILLALPFFVLQYEFQCLIGNRIWGWLSPLRQARPTLFWTPCLWRFSAGVWRARRWLPLSVSLPAA